MLHRAVNTGRYLISLCALTLTTLLVGCSLRMGSIETLNSSINSLTDGTKKTVEILDGIRKTEAYKKMLLGLERKSKIFNPRGCDSVKFGALKGMALKKLTIVNGRTNLGGWQDLYEADACGVSVIRRVDFTLGKHGEIKAYVPLAPGLTKAGAKLQFEIMSALLYQARLDNKESTCVEPRFFATRVLSHAPSAQRGKLNASAIHNKLFDGPTEREDVPPNTWIEAWDIDLCGVISTMSVELKQNGSTVSIDNVKTIQPQL